MDKRIEELALKGNNITDALERVLNDEELYIYCIDLFAKELNITDVNNLLDNQNYDELLSYVHYIKGVSSNLGLSDIYLISSRIVDDIRKKEYSLLSIKCEHLIVKYNEFKNMVLNWTLV